ncbi:hypothetical protein MPH_13512 [Macrophomina phaseolina MS6]|uniref:Uncharacterized protein n=1 Tax=Macrophomina phaseolina (strain MS6) TaxID=1126212 RepID=K2RH87_MACPH|nr:hypothetical protein MPH_13512 [Macrophomina phaseolina MS6]
MTSLRNLVQNTYSLIQWRSDPADFRYLGCRLPNPSSSVFCDIRFDSSRQNALFQFNISIALKCDKQIDHLYARVDPKQVSHLQILDLDDSDVTQLGVTTFIAQARNCASHQDVIGLQFLLTQPVTIVGPRGTTDILPKTRAAGQVLDSLRSLSLATNLTVYLPKTEALSEHVHELCTSANSGLIESTPKENDMRTLFGGSGGVDIGVLLTPLAAGSARELTENPPAYDGPSSMPGASASHKRPSNEGVTPPKPQRRRHMTRTTEERLSSLEFELAALRNQVDTQEAARSPTEDASVADRLDHFEEELRSLRSSTERIEAIVQQREGVESSFMWRANERLEEVHEIEAVIDERIEDAILQCKNEFRDWVAENVWEAVVEQLPDAIQEWLDENFEDTIESATREHIRGHVREAMRNMSFRLDSPEET